MSLGIHKLKAVFDLDEQTLEKTIPLTLLNNKRPKVYGFEIIKRKVQGTLEAVSCGLFHPQ